MLTALAHCTFFGVGSVVATGLVAEHRKASAIAVMFTGLTVATVLGVPLGTSIGQHLRWRATFCAVTLVCVAAFAIIAALVPKRGRPTRAGDWRADLAAIQRTPVLLCLLTTVLRYAGVFAVFTYIAALLTRISGLAEASVSPVLLVFGGGLVLGNLAGGRLRPPLRRLGHDRRRGGTPPRRHLPRGRRQSLRHRRCLFRWCLARRCCAPPSGAGAMPC